MMVHKDCAVNYGHHISTQTWLPGVWGYVGVAHDGAVCEVENSMPFAQAQALVCFCLSNDTATESAITRPMWDRVQKTQVLGSLPYYVMGPRV